MKRAYLEEDIELIRRYFPGASAVAMRTPFDLTQRTHLPGLHPDSFHDDGPHDLHGGVLRLG